MPDTAENRAYFGGQSGRKGSESGYPMARVVALMVLRSHLLAGAWVGPYGGTNELAGAQELEALVPSKSLMILDRGFLAASLLLGIERPANNRHWLTRAKSNNKWPVIRRLGTGDEIVEMDVSRHALKQDASLPRTWQMRAIRYRRKGFRPQVLLTSLLDVDRYPAEEIVALYHERWELELGYDELKTELLDREEAIRSKTREGVEQELWGVLLAYNLVRVEMERVAESAKVEPTRIGFVESLRLIRDEVVALGDKSRGDPEATRDDAREHEAIHLAATPSETVVSTRSEDQDEQLRPKAAAGREACASCDVSYRGRRPKPAASAPAYAGR